MKTEVEKEFRLPRLISDGMVIQRNTLVKLWGWSSPRQKIIIKFQRQKYSVKANAKGEWQSFLKDLIPGGPYELEFFSNHKTIIHNVLVGDVWVYSGQSNMELPMERVKYFYQKEIADSKNSQIRVFSVSKEHEFHSEKKDFLNGNWISATPENILKFTAVGYFFAKELNSNLKVPIGIISAAVGGAPVQAWLSPDALKLFPYYWDIAETLKNDQYVSAIKERDEKITEGWYHNLNQADKGLKEIIPWYSVGYDDSSWLEMQIPGSWEDQGINDLNGALWFRKKIYLNNLQKENSAMLHLGLIVDADQTYVNGVTVGKTAYRYPPRSYAVPAGLLRQGENEIVIRVISVRGKGGFIKGKPYNLVINGNKLDLTGNWKYKIGAATAPLPVQTFFDYQPGGLYRAMISPLIRYAIKGVAWYQGESNTDHPLEYGPMFESLIIDWRKKWGIGDFPFLFVQLANYQERGEKLLESNWALVRQAQLERLHLPKTGMAVTVDIGEWNDLHPYNKKEVGIRLAVAAKNVAYGDSAIVPMGPIAYSAYKDNNKVNVYFHYADSGLIGKNGKSIRGFEVCSLDRYFKSAKAEIHGNNVVVWNNEITNPVVVRYCWADNPVYVDLYNKEGLPASPFQLSCADRNQKS